MSRTFKTWHWITRNNKMMTIYENSVYLWRFYEFVEFQSKWFLEHILKLMRKALRIRKTMFNWIFMLPKLVQLCSDVCANSRQYDHITWSSCDRKISQKWVKDVCSLWILLVERFFIYWYIQTPEFQLTDWTYM